MSEFVQLRVYNALSELSCDAVTLAKRMEISVGSSRKACESLCRKGIVRKKYVRRRLTIFYRVMGRLPPVNKSGRVKRRIPTDSRDRMFARWLVMMQRRMGPGWRYRPHQPRHALDAVWGDRP